MLSAMIDLPPPLTDAEVQAGARPGETWEQARKRLEAARWVYTVACKHCGFPNVHLAGEVPGPMCDGCTAEFWRVADKTLGRR